MNYNKLNQAYDDWLATSPDVVDDDAFLIWMSQSMTAVVPFSSSWLLEWAINTGVWVRFEAAIADESKPDELRYQLRGATTQRRPHARRNLVRVRQPVEPSPKTKLANPPGIFVAARRRNIPPLFPATCRMTTRNSPSKTNLPGLTWPLERDQR